MKLFSRLFIFSLLLLCVSRSHAQVAPRFYIVDAMPVTQESVGGPKGSMIGLDFFIGANPRPVWWGRDWVDNFAIPEDYAGRLTQLKAGQPSEIEMVYSAAYTPRWNEALGLYTVRVRAPMKRQRWPENVSLSYKGTLPVKFRDASSFTSPIVAQAELPFALEFDARPAKSYAQARLTAPLPSVWVKRVSLYRVEPDSDFGKAGAQYEADVIVAGRPQPKLKLRRSARMTDVDGVPLPQGSRFGYTSEEFGLFSVNSAPVPLPYELTRVRFFWDETRDDSTAEKWVSQAFGYGDAVSLSIRFPVKSDGKFLEGDIAPAAWIVDLP